MSGLGIPVEKIKEALAGATVSTALPSVPTGGLSAKQPCCIPPSTREQLSAKILKDTVASHAFTDAVKKTLRHTIKPAVASKSAKTKSGMVKELKEAKTYLQAQGISADEAAFVAGVLACKVSAMYRVLGTPSSNYESFFDKAEVLKPEDGDRIRLTILSYLNKHIAQDAALKSANLPLVVPTASLGDAADIMSGGAVNAELKRSESVMEVRASRLAASVPKGDSSLESFFQQLFQLPAAKAGVQFVALAKAHPVSLMALLTLTSQKLEELKRKPTTSPTHSDWLTAKGSNILKVEPYRKYFKDQKSPVVATSAPVTRVLGTT